MRAKHQDALDIASSAGAGDQCNQTGIVFAISLLEQLERSGKIG